MARNFGLDTRDVIKTTLSSGQVNTDAMAASIWFSLDTDGNYRTYQYQGDDWPTRDWNTELDTGIAGGIHNVLLRLYGSGDFSRWYWGDPGNGAWVHMVWSHNGVKNTLPVVYQGGVAQTVTQETIAAGSTPTKGSTKWALGNWFDTPSKSGDAWGTRSMDGKLAESAVWTRELAVAEMIALSKGFSPLFFRNGLALYQPLWGSSVAEPELIKGGSGAVAGAVKDDHPRIIYPRGMR